MNILILTTHLNIGGIPRYVINLAKALADGGDRVYVASSGGQWQDELDRKGITHLTIPIKTKSILSHKIWRSFSCISGFLKGHKIDIIHANTRVTQALACILYKTRRIPYVSTFHGCYRPHFFRRLFRFQGLASIAVSIFVKNHLIDQLGISQEDIRVIYNGMDIAQYLDGGDSSQVESIKKAMPYFPLIGTISRLTSEKNIHLIIEALPQVLKRFPQARLVVLGQGRQEEELKDRAKTLDVDAKVIFLKGMHPLPVLKGLDVFITLSEGEPFGFSVIEAQAVGVPTVVSSSGALKETVQDRLTGIVLKDASPDALLEAIAMILENEELRRSIIMNARKSVEDRFTIERMASQTRSLYAQLLQRTDYDT